MRTRKAPSIEFGKEYRDRISGFAGTCTGKASYISGCDQALLTPKVGPDGRFEGQWFDDERLIDVAAAQPVKRTSRAGGPQHTPDRR